MRPGKTLADWLEINVKARRSWLQCQYHGVADPVVFTDVLDNHAVSNLPYKST